MYIPEDSIIEKNDSYIAYKARYAKNTIAVHVTGDNSWYKNVAAMYASKYSSRYSHRENAYMMSNKRFTLFKEDYSNWMNEKHINQ